MGNNQQSSVELFAKTLAEQGLLVTRDYENLVAYQQAKGMHHKEVVDFVEDWYCNGPLLGGGVNLVETIEKHYNKTFGGNND